MSQSHNNIDFTVAAYSSMKKTVDDKYFQDKDAELIYKTLEKKLKAIPFCDYLKRYIYQRAELSGSYDEIPIKEYQLIIREAFSDNCTPASFEQVTSKLSALSKNWLTRQTVKRKVVFLLGFGLKMSVDDVNNFLTKALNEATINFKDPFEIICWYCYKNGYNYLKYEKLWQAYMETPVNRPNLEAIYSEYTIGFRNSAYVINDDIALFTHLSKLKITEKQSRFSVTAREKFLFLYDCSRDLIAKMYNDTEEEEHKLVVGEYRDRLLNNDRLYDYEKRERIEQKRLERRTFKRDDIGVSDIEHVICSAIPLDRHGNLVPSKLSKFNEHFKGKRFSRQRVNDILLNNAEIERFDLITLNFFVHSQNVDEALDNKSRYVNFVDSTNLILEECGMGKLYVANPYECFVLMCILADEPLAVYADVCEMAYDN